MTEDITLRRKRLLYRADHRGFKEADLLIGGFAKESLDQMGEDELDAFEALLELIDHDVYGWVMGARPVPEAHDTPLLARLRAYAMAAHPAGA